MTITSEKPKVILVHESVMSSLIKDSFTFAMVAGLIGVGVWWDSLALQMVGGIVALVMLLGNAGRKRMARNGQLAECFTFEEARAALDKMESDNA